MALPLASQRRRCLLASAALLALGACETAPDAPQEPAAAVVDRSPRVASEIARGRQALAAGDLSSAQSAFTAALRGSPNDPEPAVGLAETYLAMGDLETAGRLFDIVAQAEGGAADARLLQGRGLVALGQGRTDEAVGYLEASVERDPAQWRAWAGLGRAYGRQGKARQARNAFGRAEESAPSPAVVINDVGMLHLEENDPAAALQAFQRALSVDPGNAIASANARIARAMLGEYDAAISGARPDELPYVLNNVGYIAVVNGDFDVADRLLRRAIETSPVYHEAASANLNLLAQAMRGAPVPALDGSGVAAMGEPAAAAAQSAGAPLEGLGGHAAAATLAGGPDPTPIHAGLSGGTAAPSGASDGRARDGWGAVLAGQGGQAPTPASGVETAPAVELAAVPPEAGAEAADGVMAYGFRWDSKPLAASPAKKRGKRKARAAAPTDPADPRGTAWPGITVPSPSASDPAGPEQAQADPSASAGEPALADDRVEVQEPEQAQQSTPPPASGVDSRTGQPE